MAGFALRAGTVAVVLATMAVLGPAPAAVQAPQQQQPQQPRPVFRGGTNIVRVDVTVTNHKGEPASDLTRDDFDVTEDGAAQTIDSFQLVHADGMPTDDRSLEIRSPEHAAAEAARDDVRLFLIFWDEYHIGQFRPAIQGRDALAQFVHTAFGPTDLVGIMDQLTTLDSIRFTRDRLQLVEQVHALKGRAGVYIPTRSPIEEGHLQFPSEIERLRAEVSMSALTSAAAFLGNFREGRKDLLFVSQGIPMYMRGSGDDQYRDIVRAANTNNTAIYTFDPASEVGRRSDSLTALAYDTGGRAFVGTNRPAELLPQMIRDASAYYLLGYASPAPFDGKFHKIKVRVKKDGYEVRARSGYFTPTPGDMDRERARVAAAAERPSDVGRALDQLTTRTDRAMDVWTGMARGSDGRTHVTVAWQPGRAAADARLSVSLRATAGDGARLFDLAGTTEHEIAFDVPPGSVKLTTRALDDRGNELDMDVRTIVVPAFDDERLAIGTPVVERARTARDVRTMVGGGSLPTEVGREFDRTDRLFVRVPVYGGADVTTSARLLNRQGAEVRTLPVARTGDGQYQVDLPLTASPRGDYLIAIEAARGADSLRVLVPIRVR